MLLIHPFYLHLYLKSMLYIILNCMFYNIWFNYAFSLIAIFAAAVSLIHCLLPEVYFALFLNFIFMMYATFFFTLEKLFFSLFHFYNNKLIIPQETQCWHRPTGRNQRCVNSTQRIALHARLQSLNLAEFLACMTSPEAGLREQKV